MGKVLHASYSGWFPTCIQETLPDIEESRLAREYAAEVTQPDNQQYNALDMIMALYWRVKTWRIYYSDFGDLGQIIQFERYYGHIDQGKQIEEEEKLVCAPVINVDSYSDWETFYFNFFTNPFLFDLGMYYSIFGFGKNNKDEYSSFRFACNFAFHKKDDGTEGAKVYSDLNSIYFTETQIADIGTFKFYYSWDVGTQGTEPTFQISAHEYWTYGGMYDKNTGLLV